MVARVARSEKPSGIRQFNNKSKELEVLMTVAHPLQNSSRRARGRAWAGMCLFLAIFATAIPTCIPPSVEELSGATDEETIIINLAKIVPEGDHVTMIRSLAEFVDFDVRGAYTSSLGEQTALEYYWYVDWDHDNKVEPILEFQQVFHYVPCGTQTDPIGPGGIYPDIRKILLVVSSEELADKSLAYLGAAEGADVTFYDWTIEFKGVEQCNF